MYIREYQNIGKLLYSKGVIIGVTYYPFIGYPMNWKEWEEYNEGFAVHPLLGEYVISDPTVIAKHIDWATGHGVNCFFLAWGSEDPSFQNRVMSNIKKFISQSISHQILIAIQYEGIPGKLINVKEREGQFTLEDSSQWAEVINDFIFLHESGIYDLPNYLRIDNKPVIYLGAASELEGKVGEFVNELNSIRPLFLVGDHAHPWTATSAYTIDNSGGWIEECDKTGECDLIEYAKCFDGWTVWAAGWYAPIKEPLNMNYPKFLNEGYRVWRKLADKYGKMFVPSVIPGFMNVREIQEGIPHLPRDPEMFKEELKIAITMANTLKGKKLIKIDSWNDFGEGHCIEPTKEEKLNFLKMLREVLLEKTLIHNLSKEINKESSSTLCRQVLKREKQYSLR